MNITIKGVCENTDVKYIQIDTFVRYWEDAEVNGKDDISFYDTKGEGIPAMPCAVKIKDKPTDNIHSNHYKWMPLIDVETGKIINWAEGTTARVHYKVCDEGIYRLLDADKNIIIEVESYVPSFLGEDGDYIIMNIDEHGVIKNFVFNNNYANEMYENRF